MKKLNIIVLLVFSLSVLNSSAQAPAGPPLLNPDALKKKLEKSDEEINDEKKSVSAKTWMKRAQLFQDVNDVNIQYLRFGMHPNEMVLYYHDPLKKSTRINEETQQQQEVYEYEKVDIIFENNRLVSWDEKVPLVRENPLQQAYDAYINALKFDTDNKLSKDIKEGLERLKTQLEMRGIRLFSSKEYEMAYKYFDLCKKVGDVPLFEGAIDSVMYYDAALSAVNANMEDEAVYYLNKCIDIGYNGENACYYLKKLYLENGDTVAALDALKKGFQKYPESTTLIIELVNFYIQTHQTDEALEYLNLAKKSDPGNKSYYFAEGSLLGEIGKREQAVEAYKAAIEIDANYFDAYYNLGVLYYNWAVEIYDEANKINAKEVKKYNEKKAEGDKTLAMAIEPMEHALNIVKENEDQGEKTRKNIKDTLEILKTLYYRLQMEDKHQEVVEELKSYEDVE